MTTPRKPAANTAKTTSGATTTKPKAAPSKPAVATHNKAAVAAAAPKTTAAPMPVAKPAVIIEPVKPQAAAAVVSPAVKAVSEKPRKKEADKKVKLVRDSFTMPEADYALFKDLKARSLAAGLEVKKSELLRAALNLLASLNDKDLADNLGQLEKIKTGRPAKKG